MSANICKNWQLIDRLSKHFITILGWIQNHGQKWWYYINTWIVLSSVSHVGTHRSAKGRGKKRGFANLPNQNIHSHSKWPHSAGNKKHKHVLGWDGWCVFSVRDVSIMQWLEMNMSKGLDKPLERQSWDDLDIWWRKACRRSVWRKVDDSVP